MIIAALANFIASDLIVQSSFGDRVYLNDMPELTQFTESICTLSMTSDYDTDYIMPIRNTSIQVSVHNEDYVKALQDSAVIESLLNRYQGSLSPEFKVTSISITGRNTIQADNRWVVLVDYQLVWK